MRNSKKILTLLTISSICIIVFLAGCGKKVEKSDITGKVLYDLYVLGDLSSVEKIGLTQDDAEKVRDTEKDGLKQQTKLNFSKSGVSIDDSKLDDIVNAQIDSLKKLSGTVEIVSEDKESTKVKVTTNYIDVSSIDQKALDDATEEVKAMGLTSYSEVENKLIEVYIKKLINNFNSAEPSKEKNEKTFTFTKQKFNVNGKMQDIWMPEDMNKFGESIGRMITNNK